MKVIETGVDTTNTGEEGNVFFVSPTSFLVYRRECGIRVGYSGDLERVGDCYSVVIRCQEGPTVSDIKFVVPYMPRCDDENERLSKVLLSTLNELAPVEEEAVKREMPEWLKYAIRAIAVIAAIQVGNCVRSQYQIEQAIKQEATAQH